MRKLASIETQNKIPELELGKPDNAGIFSALIRQALFYQVTAKTIPLAARVSNNQPVYRLTDTQEQPLQEEKMISNLLLQVGSPLGIAGSFLETNRGGIEEIVTTPGLPMCMMMLAGFRLESLPNSINSLALKAPEAMRVIVDEKIQILEIPKVSKRRAADIIMPFVDEVVCKYCPWKQSQSCSPSSIITKSSYYFDDTGRIALKVPYSQFFEYAR